MKLRNKKTGEMGDLIIDKAFLVVRTGTAWEHYSSLAELNEVWEDYEEPNYFYCISIDGSINKYEVERYAHESWCKNGAKIIGNYFETREEAEKAVEKLMAWNRLRECGLIPLTWTNVKGGCLLVKYGIGGPGMMDCLDFDLLFGGEE